MAREQRGAIVSDGYINVTLLKFKVDRYGGAAWAAPLGIKVEDLAQAEGQIAPLGAVELAEGTPPTATRRGHPSTGWGSGSG